MDKRIYFNIVIIFFLSTLLTTCRLEGDIEALRKKSVENPSPSVTPSAPTTAPTIIAGSEQLTVSWQAVEGATAYEVWAGTANNSNTATKRGGDVSGLSAVITGLTNSTTYYVWIKAKNSVGTSGFSPVASGTPSISVTAPQAPSTPTISIGDEQITVTWTAAQGATAYEVWLGTENNSATAAKHGEDVSGTTVTLTNLTNGTTYYVWLKAKNSVGTSGFSLVASGTPSVLATAPQTPSTPAVNTGDEQITVTWAAVQGAIAYEVWLGTENNSATAAKHGGDVSGTTVTLTNLTNGTTYYVWLKAKNSVGTSEFSPVASGTPSVLVTAPQTPSTPAVSTGNEQITVTWAAVQGATAYEVWLGTENNSATAAKRGEDVSGTTVTLTNLINGTTYYVWLKAKNSIGTSEFSPVASGTPLGTNNERSPGLYRENVKIGDQNLSDALSYISSNVVSGDDFYIVLGANESASPINLNYSGKTVGITLLGYGEERTITLASNGSMFTIDTGVTLTLDENITLMGRNSNTSSLVSVASGATLIMNVGAKISENTSFNGGISVYGTFTMNGGTISRNTANGNGGGIYMSNGTVTINGGIISGNTRSGIYMYYSGTCTMNGGTISGNTESGIAVLNNATFIMNGGTISGNMGTGIYISTGAVTMHGGVISGNGPGMYYGGGVYRYDTTSGSFKKLPPSTGGQNSGIIYGSEETGTDANGVPLKNTSIYGSNVFYSLSQRRDTTAGQTDHIDTTTGRGLSSGGNPPYGE